MAGGDLHLIKDRHIITQCVMQSGNKKSVLRNENAFCQESFSDPRVIQRGGGEPGIDIARVPPQAPQSREEA